MAAALASALLLVWLRGAVWQALLVGRWIVPACVAAAEALAAVGVSAGLFLVMRRILPQRGEPGVAAHLILGLPLFGTLAYLVALVSTAKAPMAVLLALAAAAGLARLMRARPRAFSSAAGGAGWVAAAMLGVAFAIALFWATLPPATIDEVAYHLAVPKTWVLDGRAVELPLLANSYFPFGVESAHLPALSLLGEAGALSAHLVHLAVAAAVLTIAMRWAAGRSSLGSALLAAAAIATVPALVTTAGLVWIEWPLLGSALLLLFSLQTEDDATAALAVAAGLLTKYTFAVYALALFAAALYLARRRGVVLAFVAGGALGSVFCLRNLVQTGNPLAPFLGKLAPALSHFNAAGSIFELLRRYVYDANLIDESLGATLFICIVLLAAAWRSLDRFVRAMSLALAIAALLLFQLGPSARLLLPFLAPLALFGAVSIERLPWPALLRALLLVASGFQILSAAFFLNTFAPFSILQKGPDGGPQLSEKSFLAQRVENFFPSIDLVNAKLPQDARVLVVGLQRLYWFSQSARGGGNFDGPRVAAALDAGSPDELRARFARDGITHVAVFKTLLLVSDDPAQQGFGAETRTTLPHRTLQLLRDTMERHATSLGGDKAVELYQLH